LKIPKPNISMFWKNYGFKYIKRYIQEEHPEKKIQLKNTLYFRKYKRQIFDKIIYYFTTTLLLFTIRNLSFYILQNTTYFLTRLFCIHFFCKYLPIYFNTIIF
jgi:hypothetical protein